MDSIWKRKCNNLAHNLDSVESFFARLLRNQKDSRKEREKLEFNLKIIEIHRNETKRFFFLWNLHTKIHTKTKRLKERSKTPHRKIENSKNPISFQLRSILIDRIGLKNKEGGGCQAPGMAGGAVCLLRARSHSETCCRSSVWNRSGSYRAEWQRRCVIRGVWWRKESEAVGWRATQGEREKEREREGARGEKGETRQVVVPSH